MARSSSVPACTTAPSRDSWPNLAPACSPLSIRRPPPADTSIVGVWTFDDLSDPGGVVVFTADGVYYSINGDGFERGFYTFDGSPVMLTTLLDTNGAGGFSGDNGLTIPLPSSETRWTTRVSSPDRDYRQPRLHRRWMGRGQSDSKLTTHSCLVAAESQVFRGDRLPETAVTSEAGTYTWDPVTHELVATVGGADPGNFVTPSPDWRSLHVLGDDGERRSTWPASSIPATIPVIPNTPLSASGIVGAGVPFRRRSDQRRHIQRDGTAGRARPFNSSTGAISGTPDVGGQFAVTDHGHQRGRCVGHRNAHADASRYRRRSARTWSSSLKCRKVRVR